MKWYNDDEQTIPKNEWPVNTNNRLKELIYIKKPTTEQEEWQMIWRYCPNVMKYTIEGPSCPHDLGLSDSKELEGKCDGDCYKCWHDSIWGDGRK